MNEHNIQYGMEGMKLNEGHPSTRAEASASAGKPWRGCGPERRGCGMKYAGGRGPNACQVKHRRMRMMHDMMKAAAATNNAGSNAAPTPMAWQRGMYHPMHSFPHYGPTMMAHAAHPCGRPSQGPYYFRAGFGPMHPGINMMAFRQMHLIQPYGGHNHLNMGCNSNGHFPGFMSKPHCKRHKKTEKEGGKMNEEEKQAELSEVTQSSANNNSNGSENTPQRKNGRCQWRKRMRRAAEMNSCMLPGEIMMSTCDAPSSFWWNHMTGAGVPGRRHMMHKWWSKMQESTNSDSEDKSASSSSSSDENDNTEGDDSNKEQKNDGEKHSHCQQRRQMKRRAIDIYAAGMMGQHAPLQYNQVMAAQTLPPPAFVRAFIKRQMRKHKHMENDETRKEQCDEESSNSSSDERIEEVASGMPDESTSENILEGEENEMPVLESSEENLQPEKDKKDRKTESPHRRNHNMRRVMAMNAYMFPGFSGGSGLFPPPPQVQQWMQRQMWKKQKADKEEAPPETDVQGNSKKDDFEKIVVDN